MKCPYCGALESRVVDSRSLEEEVRRRRVCSACGVRFTTSERVQSHALSVVKKDGRREEFDREKLASGIRKACEKRPLPAGSVDKLISGIEDYLHGLGRAEISTSTIGDLVMAQLASFDHIAYIRFASVYRDFTDIGALKDALDRLSAGDGVRQAPSESPPQIP
jgi:transcriptional repressor NrdR